MFDKLKIKFIYDDFLSKVNLTEEQVRILNMLIDKESILKISMEIGVCERTISSEIKKLKEMYKKYCEVELTRLHLLLD